MGYLEETDRIRAAIDAAAQAGASETALDVGDVIVDGLGSGLARHIVADWLPRARQLAQRATSLAGSAPTADQRRYRAEASLYAEIVKELAAIDADLEGRGA